MVGTVRIPVQVVREPAASAAAPVKLTCGSTCVAPLATSVLSSPVPAVPPGGVSAPVGTGTPSRSSPTAKRMLAPGAACWRAESGLTSRPVNPTTRALPPPPTRSCRAVGPITASDRRSAPDSGSAPPSFFRRTAPCSATARAMAASAWTSIAGRVLAATVAPVGDAWSSRPKRSRLERMCRTAPSTTDCGMRWLVTSALTLAKLLLRNSMSRPAWSWNAAAWAGVVWPEVTSPEVTLRPAP